MNLHQSVYDACNVKPSTDKDTESMNTPLLSKEPYYFVNHYIFYAEVISPHASLISIGKWKQLLVTRKQHYYPVY